MMRAWAEAAPGRAAMTSKTRKSPERAAESRRTDPANRAERRDTTDII
jgi:hypothetical protein